MIKIHEDLIYDDGNIRAFITDKTSGPCPYLSETFGKQAYAVIVYHTKFNNIALSFSGSEYGISAKDIMQYLFGDKADGNDVTAFSPDDETTTILDCAKVFHYVKHALEDRNLANHERQDVVLSTYAYGIANKISDFVDDISRGESLGRKPIERYGGLKHAICHEMSSFGYDFEHTRTAVYEALAEGIYDEKGFMTGITTYIPSSEIVCNVSLNENQNKAANESISKYFDISFDILPEESYVQEEEE